MADFTSRERILRVVNLEEADHTPCCFMNFKALRSRSNSFYRLVEDELALGLDSQLIFPSFAGVRPPEHPALRGLPIRFHSAVKIREWREKSSDSYDILHNEYSTPAGKLTSSVQMSLDWPFGEHIPFIDDHLIPRYVKPLITGPEDLEALQYLLLPPQADDIASFKEEAEKATAFAKNHGVMLSGMMGVAMDMADWMCGTQNTMILSIDQPEFMADLLEMIHVWNMERMKVVLSAPVDIYIRRAWYEGCDSVTPKFYSDTILPRLKKEVDLAHEHGTKFGYTCTSGTTAMLDSYLEADFDVLIGIDPVQDPYMDMQLVKEKLGGRICLWGGISTLTIEQEANEEKVRSDIQHTVNLFKSTPFILSPHPVPNNNYQPYAGQNRDYQKADSDTQKQPVLPLQRCSSVEQVRHPTPCLKPV